MSNTIAKKAQLRENRNLDLLPYDLVLCFSQMFWSIITIFWRVRNILFAFDGNFEICMHVLKYMYLSYHDDVTPKGRINTSYAMPSKALYREISHE